MLSFFCCLAVAILLCGCQSMQSSAIPENPPPEWHLSAKIYGTTAQPGQWHRLVSVYTSGQTPGYLVARLPKLEPDKKASVPFTTKLSHSEMHQFYQLASSAIRGHVIGQKPDVVVRDGSSLSIRLNVFDRHIDVGYDNSGVIPTEAKALLDGINSHLPEKYQLQWQSWVDTQKERKPNN